jgi:hypothetical protein
MSVFQNKNDLLFNVNNPHTLISRNKDTSFEKNLHYFSINTNDRDKKLYPNTNNFTIRLPATLSGITSFSLFSIFFTGPIYNFSKNLGNSSFKIGTYSTSETESSIIKLLQDGNYDIKGILNYINEILSSFNDINIRINYLISQNRFVFYTYDRTDNAISERFFLENDNSKISNNGDNYSSTSYKDLLFTLGFDVNTNYKRIDSIFTTDIVTDVFLFKDNLIITSDWDSDIQNNKQRFFVMAQSQPRFRSEEPIFLEIEKFNVNISETGDTINDSHHINNRGSVNSSFAKIDANSYNFSTFNALTSGTINGLVDNVTKKFTQPVNNINHFRFKFRYRDNTLVDLQNTSIDFTIAMERMHETIAASI